MGMESNRLERHSPSARRSKLATVISMTRFVYGTVVLASPASEDDHNRISRSLQSCLIQYSDADVLAICLSAAVGSKHHFRGLNLVIPSCSRGRILAVATNAWQNNELR